MPIPTLGVAIGMIGVAVARSCRVVFRLGSPLSIALALTTTTGPVFLYVVLNYFLAQIVFASVLLTVALTVLEFRDGGARDVAGRNLVLAAGAAAAVLSYDVWALQYAVLIAALLAVAEGRDGRRRPVVAGPGGGAVLRGPGCPGARRHGARESDAADAVLRKGYPRQRAQRRRMARYLSSTSTCCSVCQWSGRAWKRRGPASSGRTSALP